MHVPRQHHWKRNRDQVHGSDCHLKESVVHPRPVGQLFLWIGPGPVTGILRFLLKLIILQ